MATRSRWNENASFYKAVKNGSYEKLENQMDWSSE